MLSDIALAITEATTNVVLHAYRDRAEPGTVNIKAERDRRPRVPLRARRGQRARPRVDSPGLGLGLGLIAQVADSADVRAPETGGTEVIMRFNVVARRLESLRDAAGALRARRFGRPRARGLARAAHARGGGRAALDAAGLPPRAGRRVRQARHAAPRLRRGGRGRARARLRAGAAAARRPRRRLPLRSRWRSTSCGRSRTRSSAPTTRFADEGERLAGALRDARRRRARGRGAGRVLPGRLQRQRPRAGEADRHRPAARPRRARCSAPRSSSATARASAPCSTTSTPRSSSPGTPTTAGAVDEEVPGVTLDAVEAAVIAAYGDARAGDAGRGHARPRPPPRTPTRTIGDRALRFPLGPSHAPERHNEPKAAIRGLAP